MSEFKYLFDIRALSLINGLISLTLIFCMVYTLATQKVYKGFRKWTLATIFNTIGFILLGFRGILPDFLSVVVCNMLMISAYILIKTGLNDFAEIRQKRWLDIAIAFVYLVTVLYYTYLKPTQSLRIVFFSLVAALYCVKSAGIVFTKTNKVINRTNWLLLAGFVIISLLFILRSVVTFINHKNIVNLMSADIFQGITFIVGFNVHIIIIVGFIVMNSQRLDFDLGRANSNIKSLKGLLPICSSCKKIRDDKGYWNQIENYIKNHSEADFSHGICPECSKKLYPDLDDN